MTRRIILSAIAAIACFASAMAQLTASEAFASAPTSVFPLLDGNTRLDMIDYFNSGMDTPSANALKGSSQITQLSPMSLTVKMTDSSTAQLILLPLGNETIIGVISTVATPGLDSSIAFYDSKWNPLQTGKFFNRPSWDEWLSDEGRGHRADVEMQVPFMLTSYSFDPKTRRMTLANNLSKFLDEDIYSIVSPYLREQLVYTWNGKKFDLSR